MFSKILFPWRQAMPAILVSAAILVSSCSDDDPATDNTFPEVTLTSTAKANMAWNTVTFTIEGTDNSGVQALGLKIDDTLVKTVASSSFDYAWDTQTVAEGLHTITAIAIDNSGNEKTAEIKLTVQNILLKADVPSDFLSTGASAEKGYIFLSDKDGKVIIAEQFENGDHIELRAPAYTEGTFHVTEVVSKPAIQSTELVTTTEVSRGQWVLSSYVKLDQPTVIGSTQLTFINAAKDMDYLLKTNGGEGLTDESQTTAEISLKYDPSMLYVESGDGNSYGLFSAVKVGSNPAIDLSTVNKAFTKETLHVPQGISTVSMRLNGLPSAAITNRNRIDLRNYTVRNATEFEISYPGTFPAYSSVVEMYGDGISAYNLTKTVNDIALLNADIDIAVAGNKFTGSATGDLDFLVYSVYKNDVAWSLYSKKGTQSVAIPEIPAMITGLASFSLEDADITLWASDFYKIDGYDGLLTFIKGSEHGNGDLDKDFLTEQKELSLDFTNSGSRQSAGSRRFANGRRHLSRERN